jgi:RNA polymerase sigma-70 factor, ECF subfamily
VRPRDPLDNPEALIRRVYAYLAYRVGEGPHAEDLTSDVFERAVRYRSAYDPGRGEPISWLIGIARRVVADRAALTGPTVAELPESNAFDLLEDAAIERIGLGRALVRLGGRERELLALRYGADLTARRLGELLGMKPNAVEVALHRALDRLKMELERREEGPQTGQLRPRRA